jgi:protein Mpv17
MRPFAGPFAIFVFLLSSATTSVASLAPPLQAWQAYKVMLVQQPIITKAVTSAVIMSISDGITQRIERHFTDDAPEEEKKSIQHNWNRTWITAKTGLLWSGVSAHVWYANLERICSLIPVEGPIAGLALRLFLDALIFSPITITGFFIVNTLVQHGIGSVPMIQEKLETKWKKTLFAAWSFWPIVNIVNFSMVPLSYRVLYSNVMALLWTGYLSFVNNQRKSQSQPQAAAAEQTDERAQPVTLTQRIGKTNRKRPMFARIFSFL